MKNLFTSLIICVLAALILSSCGSSSFITKRRYTKGYYVSNTHGKHKTPVSTPTGKTERADVVTISPAPAADPELKAPAATAPEKNVLTQKKSASRLDAIKNKIAAKQAVKSHRNNDADQQLSIGEFKQSHNKLPSLRPTAGSDDDALSLFWIVIIVLLVLYLLGVISGGWGLGILIHLLLILALILLILWLLRIL